MSKENVTQLIKDWQNGEASALDSLTPIIYEELKRLAQGYMWRESTGHTLQATALVNEAFIQLADAKVDFSGRSHFLATAARMMRRTLVDHARAKGSQKRGGGQFAVTLNEELAADMAKPPELVEMDQALTRLEEQDAPLAIKVELVYFGGLTYKEAAEYLGISRSALYEDLRFAKAWLKKEME